MEFQPLINIGMIGHVSDGKTTIVKAITGQETQRFSQEKHSNLTIRLGYANAKIIKCEICPEPECYGSVASTVFDYKCKKCNNTAILVNHVSFVDCPGHHSFMQTMLGGTSVMDYTILVESLGNKNIPAPQTITHLDCIENTEIENIMIILNKIDLVSKEKTFESIQSIKTFITKYKAKSNPIIPISASLDINIDIICSLLAKLKPKKEVNCKNTKMNIIRSFNTNKPGTTIENLKGGVIGGSIQYGTISNNDFVYIYPGIIFENSNSFQPIEAKVLSINSDKNNLNKAQSGGLIGIQLDIDPGLTGSDKLVGDIVTNNQNGIVTKNIIISNLDGISNTNDNLYITISSQTIKIINKNQNEDNLELELEKPIYIEYGDIVTLFLKNIDSINFIGMSKIINSRNNLIINLFYSNI